MKRSSIKNLIPLDAEEAELMQAEADGTLKKVSRKEFTRLSKKLVLAAKNAVETRKLISIKVRESDLAQLKQEADKKGLRYQSLINSIIHQYVTGHLQAV